jgi:anti-anti-sigma factor
MTTSELKHLRLSMVNDVVLVEITSKDLQGPELADELDAELNTVAGQDWAQRLLIDFRHVRFLSSTGFATLLALANRARVLGRELKFCGMHTVVRLGADMVGLGDRVEFYPDEAAGLRAFEQN